MRILCLFYLVKLENLSNLRIKIKQTNLIELKLDLTIILNNTYKQLNITPIYSLTST